MRDLFYSKEENVLFWIAGYCKDLNTDSVSEKIASLKSDASTLADVAKVDIGSVMTYEIAKSSRYRNMRCFYLNNFTGSVPEDAYELTGHTFQSWVSH